MYAFSYDRAARNIQNQASKMAKKQPKTLGVTDETVKQDINAPSDFENSAPAHRDVGFFAEFWLFLKFNKKWWLLPIVVIVLLLGALMFLAGTGAAPFIYSLF